MCKSIRFLKDSLTNHLICTNFKAVSTKLRGYSTKLRYFTCKQVQILVLRAHSCTGRAFSAYVCARQHVQRQAVHNARVWRTAQRARRYVQSEAPRIGRWPLANMGLRRVALQLVQQGARILKGVYEVNHLVCTCALSCTHVERTWTRARALARSASDRFMRAWGALLARLFQLGWTWWYLALL